MANLIGSLKVKFAALKHDIRHKGFTRAVMNYAYEIYYKRYFLKRGVFFPNFSDNLEQTNILTLHKDAHADQFSSFHVLMRGFKRIPIKPSSIQFLDIGCGAGRALVTGMKLGFKKVIGIDLDQPALDMARKNCHAMKLHGCKTDFYIYEEDATGFQIPAGTNLVYMFNPFGLKTLEQVIANILAYTKISTEDLYLLYTNPTLADVFSRYSQFEKLYSSQFSKNKQPEMTIYKIAPQRNVILNQAHTQKPAPHSLPG